MSYSAIVGKAKVRPHTNADRLQIATIYETQCIVGLDTQDGDLLILFPCDGQLSSEFAEANNLIGYTDPETGEHKGGYFGKSRRVRAQKLRGEISEGFCCTLQQLALTPGVKYKDVEKLEEGDQFTEISGVLICNKYVNPATLFAREKGPKNKQKGKRKKILTFPEHKDTKQFRYEVNNIPENSVIYLTVKCHGTSQRYSYCLIEEESWSWWKRFLFKVGIRFNPKITRYWKHMGGSRRVNLDPKLSKDTQCKWHGNNKFRFDLFEDKFKHLHKGEVIYGELVGYSAPDKPIMAIVDTSKLNDKKFTKQYGKLMTFSYGCKPSGEHKFYVYRITMVNEDGIVFDLPWPGVKRRCEQLGLEHVIEVPVQQPIVYKSSEKEKLIELVKREVTGPDPLDPSHIKEGIVVRVETGNSAYFLKHKSYEFLALEGLVKDNPDIVDIEESE